MDDTQRIVKCGSLSLHSSGSFFKRWQAKYLVLYDGSKSGIKRLELFDSEIKFKKQIPAKIIPLLECIRVVTCQRQKTTYTFEVRTNEQFYLLAAQSFQDMNDWVNCLRLVAFGSQTGVGNRAAALTGPGGVHTKRTPAANHLSRGGTGGVDVLLEKRASYTFNRKDGSSLTTDEPPTVPTETHPLLAAATGRTGPNQKLPVATMTASQAAAAAASALAKTRQRQPSLLGSVKPQPPADSPFIQGVGTSNGDERQIHNDPESLQNQQLASLHQKQPTTGLMPIKHKQTLTGLDEEEENMLYCSIEDNPSEHNYRVKIIETELSHRCQLKCYQLSAPTTVSQQYERLDQFQQTKLATSSEICEERITFYQLLVGPQELILLNDYASSVAMHQSLVGNSRQQGLWSWPYQCIRRYGFDKDNCFMFEAGRKCTSGPGQFIVQTPKAYNIYQDVVAFVNKLKSTGVNAAGVMMLEPVPEASQQAEAEQQEKIHNKPSVTQIPVVWTPLISTSEQQQRPAPVSMERRKQFFNSLQLHSSQKGLSNEAVSSSLSESPTSQTSLNGLEQTCSIASSATLQDNQVKRCTDVADKSGTSETDESGYEHGDESVDSNKWIRKTRSTSDGQTSTANVNKKRQQPATSDSMSSASSTSSGGSPGHSVSRRANVPTQQQSMKGRPQLILNSGQNIDGNVEDKRRAPVRLGAVLDSLARDNSEDFEANLIRDVYSEINKLHAKFAVASGSVDDSMSSHSSNDGFGEHEHEENNSSSDGNRLHGELVYSNLNRAFSRSKSDLNLDHGRGDEFNSGHACRDRQIYRTGNGGGTLGEKYRHQYSCNPHNSNSNSEFDQHKPHSIKGPYSGPTYPTTLNPIPECGEPTMVVHPPVKSPRGIRRYSSSLSNSNSKLIYHPTSDDMSKPATSSNQTKNRQLKHQSGATVSTASNSNGASLIPKLPTKHYVINDVQYAKISRNIGPKIESCL